MVWNTLKKTSNSFPNLQKSSLRDEGYLWCTFQSPISGHPFLLRQNKALCVHCVYIPPESHKYLTTDATLTVGKRTVFEESVQGVTEALKHWSEEWVHKISRREAETSLYWWTPHSPNYLIFAIKLMLRGHRWYWWHPYSDKGTPWKRRRLFQSIRRQFDSARDRRRWEIIPHFCRRIFSQSVLKNRTFYRCTKSNEIKSWNSALSRGG